MSGESKMTQLSGTWPAFSKHVKSVFGIKLSEKQLEQLKLYLENLKEWNVKFNLISFKSEEEIVWRHFADSMAGIKAVKSINNGENIRMLDVGSGAGLPGIVIKIACPAYYISLLEATNKKSSFHEHVISSLGLKDINTVNMRAEEAARADIYREKYDFAVSRAFSALSPNLEMSLPFVKTGGASLIYKTLRNSEEAKVSGINETAMLFGGRYENSFFYQIPGQNSKYAIMIFKKEKTTPAQYPRRTGMPQKRPL
jgi:16S rRNA (guanine527-N7)-methyltransferase